MIPRHKIKQIEKYISDFALNRYDLVDSFYRGTHRDRHTGIYLLKHGTKLMDYLINIYITFEEKLSPQSLIPEVFASPEQMISFLLGYRQYIEENKKLLSDNICGQDTSYIITDLIDISESLIYMIDYVKQWYDADDSVVPYLDMRYCLTTRDVDQFIKYLQQIFASISYAINKTSEGAYHSNLHLILKLLGFNIISEDETNIGRIDATIKLSDSIYIIEVKKSESKDESKIALNQIKTKKYHQKYMCDDKQIIGLGISFSTKERNINGYQYQILN